MAYNPYYIPQQKYPTYNQGYYSTDKMNNFHQSMPNQNSFSTGGSFQNQQVPQTQSGGSGGGNVMGGIGSVTQGVGQIAGHIGEGMAEAKAINPNLESQQQTDAFGKPLYTLGADQQRMYNTDVNVGKGMVGKTTLAGASAGAAFGPWGAAIGAVVGLGAGLIGKGAAKRKAKKRKIRLFNNLQTAKRTYNDQNIMFEQNQMARSSYEDQLRQYNPYGLPSNYY